MVLPREPEQPLRQVSKSGVLWAMAAAVLTLAVLANLTRVSEPDDPTATTLLLREPTTTLAFRPQGEPLEFSRVLDLEGRRPLAVAERDGRILVFTAAEPDRLGGGAGMEVLTTQDGREWESLGTAIRAPLVVIAVGETKQGHLAHGWDPTVGSAVLWTSTDGLTWQPSYIDPEGIDQQFVVTGTYADDRMTLVHGWVGGFDRVAETVHRAVADRYPHLELNVQYHPIGVDRYAVTLIGPLGIPLIETTSEELGLTAGDLRASGPSDQIPVLWASRAGATWESVPLSDPSSIGQVFAGPDGRIWAFGNPPQSGFHQLYASDDGTNWELVSRAPGVFGYVEPWREGWAAWSINRNDLVVTSDLEDWRTTGVSELFGDDTPWSIVRMAGGNRGIAAVMVSRSSPTRLISEQYEVERGGYLLRVTEPFVSIVELASGDVLVRVARWSSSVDRGTNFDLEAETVTFVDSSTSMPLLTFTLDQLATVEGELAEGWVTEGEPAVFLYSPDGFNWTAQAFPSPMGSVAGLAVLGDRVAASVVTCHPRRFGLETSEIWMAPLPPGS